MRTPWWVWLSLFVTVLFGVWSLRPQGLIGFALPAQDHKSSSGEESHLSALTDPDGTLSRHPALTPRPPVVRRVPTRQTTWGPVSRCAPASASTHARRLNRLYFRRTQCPRASLKWRST